MKLSPLIHQFFGQYLPHIKGVSHNTIKAYRDTFKLFLPFVSTHYSIKIKSLRVEHISSELIIAFLNDLQRCYLPRYSGCRVKEIYRVY
jgi:site-specific recombinase XerD